MPQMQKNGAVQILRQDGPAAHRAKYPVSDAALSGRLCVYKQRTSRWIKGCNCSEGYYPDESGRVYGKTIPYLAKTCLQRTGLPELIHANMKTDPEKYLVVLKRMPNLEQLTKAGLFRLAVECTQDYYKLSSIFQTTPV